MCEGMPPAGGASQTDEPSWLHNINDIFIYISIVIDISRLVRSGLFKVRLGSLRVASRYGIVIDISRLVRSGLFKVRLGSLRVASRYD